MRKITTTTSKELSDEKLQKLKKNAIGVLAEVRRTMLNQFPFVGSIAMSLDIVPVRDLRCPTACTDGQAIYFDIDFLSQLKNDERLFVLAHEVYHNVMLHPMRKEARDHELWNIATDIEVNEMLIADGLSCIKDGCTCKLFNLPTDKAAEEYYELLLKQNKNQKSNNGNKDNINQSTSGQFDKHIDENYDAESDKNNSSNGDGYEIQDKYGKVGFDKDFRPRVSESAVEKIREAAVAAAQQIERSRGELPGHLKRLLNGLLEPKLDWRELLSKFVTRCAGEHRTWSRPNRRFAYTKTYLPSSVGEKIKIAIGLDTSGSTSRDITRFMTEMNSLVSNFNYELHVIQCDTEVGSYEVYDNDNPLDLINTKYNITGGGGTVLTPIFKLIEEKNLDVDCVAIMTDGYTEEFDENNTPKMPIIWCVTKDGDTKNLKVGEIAKLD